MALAVALNFGQIGHIFIFFRKRFTLVGSVFSFVLLFFFLQAPPMMVIILLNNEYFFFSRIIPFYVFFFNCFFLMKQVLG